jgi:hypothetical protein
MKGQVRWSLGQGRGRRGNKGGYSLPDLPVNRHPRRFLDNVLRQLSSRNDPLRWSKSRRGRVEPVGEGGGGRECAEIGGKVRGGGTLRKEKNGERRRTVGLRKKRTTRAVRATTTTPSITAQLQLLVFDVFVASLGGGGRASSSCAVEDWYMVVVADMTRCRAARKESERQ